MKHLLNSIFLLVLIAAPVLAVAEEGVLSPEEHKMEASVRKIKSSLSSGSNSVSSAMQSQAVSEPPDASGSFVLMMKGLGFCLGVLFIGTAIAKRFRAGGMTQGRGHQSMRIIDRIPVSPKSALLLVDVEGERVLVAVGNEQVVISRPPVSQKHTDVSEEVCLEEQLPVPLRQSA